MITFKSFDVNSNTFDTAILTWEISPSLESLSDYQIKIYRGENEISLSGIDVAGSGIDYLPTSTFLYEDDYVKNIQYDKAMNVFYQLSAKHKIDSIEYKSEIRGLNVLSISKVSREIARRDMIVFKNVIRGKYFLLKIKTTGNVCSCYDDILGEKVIVGDHIVCYNTSIVDGYYDPYMLYGNMGSFSENARIGPVGGIIETNVTQFVTGIFPHISVNDILIDKLGRRWRVGYNNGPESKMDPYRQLLSIQEIDRSDIIYKFPVDLTILNSY